MLYIELDPPVAPPPDTIVAFIDFSGEVIVPAVSAGFALDYTFLVSLRNA